MSEENVLFANMNVKVAFVIDNEVVDILHTDERLGSILLSNPTIIDVSNHLNKDGQFNLPVGAIYNQDTQSFSHPSLG